MTQRSREQWIEYLVRAAPGLESVYDEHIADFDELLPHVFLGAVARYVANGFTSGDQDPLHRSHRIDAEKVLRVLEESVATRDPAVLELVSVSFLENIDWAGIGGELIRSAMGPQLRRELERRERG